MPAKSSAGREGETVAAQKGHRGRTQERKKSGSPVGHIRRDILARRGRIGDKDSNASMYSFWFLFGKESKAPHTDRKG